jgi:hypothetical protein
LQYRDARVCWFFLPVCPILVPRRSAQQGKLVSFFPGSIKHLSHLPTPIYNSFLSVSSGFSQVTL